MTVRVMYDAVDAADVPSSGFDLLAGYTNGLYQSYPTLKTRFPHALVVRIDVLNHPGAGQVLDIEQGDARPDEAPDWFDKSLKAGVHRPTLYYSSSAHHEVKAAMGSRHYDAWIASYGVSHCPIASDATCNVVAWQKIDHGPNGENIDISDVFDDSWNPTGGDEVTDDDVKKIVDAMRPVIIQEVAAALSGTHDPIYAKNYAARVHAARDVLGQDDSGAKVKPSLRELLTPSPGS